MSPCYTLNLEAILSEQIQKLFDVARASGKWLLYTEKSCLMLLGCLTHDTDEVSMTHDTHKISTTNDSVKVVMACDTDAYS